MLTGGLLHSEEASFPGVFPFPEAAWAALEDTYQAMQAKLARLFDREGVAPHDRRFERSIYMKYRLQPSALSVPVHAGLSQDAVVAAFEARYADLYGPNAGYRAAGIEIVKCRLDGLAETVVPALAQRETDPDADIEAARKASRQVFFPETGEMRDTPVYDGAALVPGMAFTGPVIIERMGDTIVLPSFAQAKVDGFANVVIDVGPARSGS